MACVIHPGSAHVTLVGGRGYCAACQTGIRAAAARLDPHVTPPDCFVWYRNTADGWTPIFGTGCAHYVAHQLNIHNGSSGDKCLAGYTYRVPVLLTHLTAVTGGLPAVRVGDVWVNAARSHTGI